jgi:hypothetical protein
MSSQELEYDKTLWHRNGNKYRTHIEMYRCHLMRLGFLNGFQKALDILEIQNKTYKDIQESNYVHGRIMHWIMNLDKERYKDLNLKLKKEFDEDMEECRAIAILQGLNKNE